MKKLLLILLLVLSLPVISQTYNLNANYLVVSDGIDTKEGKTDVDMVLNVSSSTLTIYSKDIQLIDYIVIKSYEEKGYTVFEANATDTKYRRIGLKLSFANNANAVIVTIKYSDVRYSYICKIMSS